MSNRERDAIGVFLQDLYHHKDVRRRMLEAKEKFEKEELLEIVAKLKGKEVLDEEEAAYLRKRISALYEI